MGSRFLSIPTQWPIKIQLAIEPHRVDRPVYPAACRLLVDGARDQCRCLTLCCSLKATLFKVVCCGVKLHPTRKSALLAFRFRYSMMDTFYWVWAAICPLLTNW